MYRRVYANTIRLNFNVALTIACIQSLFHPLNKKKTKKLRYVIPGDVAKLIIKDVSEMFANN